LLSSFAISTNLPIFVLLKEHFFPPFSSLRLQGRFSPPAFPVPIARFTVDEDRRNVGDSQTLCPLRYGQAVHVEDFHFVRRAGRALYPMDELAA
jgi:hypothetical protein